MAACGSKGPRQLRGQPSSNGASVGSQSRHPGDRRTIRRRGGSPNPSVRGRRRRL